MVMEAYHSVIIGIIDYDIADSLPHAGSQPQCLVMGGVRVMSDGGG